MQPILTCAEVRAREQRAIQELGLPSLLLMENAGRGCADLLRSLGIAGRVVVCCGKGNNGGDGLVMARHLDNAGHRVHVLLFGRPDELSPDAAVNNRVLQGSGVSVDVLAGESVDADRIRVELATAEWIVDALFGTGFRGPLKAPFDVVIEQINDSPAKVLAVDLPSGLDGDTGQPLGPAVIAEHTATLVALKTGLIESAAKPWVGRLHLIDVGLPRRFLC